MDRLKRWVAAQFTTRVIVTMPIAIAFNIAVGYTCQSVLKLPIYLDSTGTIIVGVLAGPLAGALTGILTNLIWQYAPGIGSGSSIAPFAGTAAAIGLLAGLWGYLGVFRSRPAGGVKLALQTGLAVAIIGLLAWRMYTIPTYGEEWTEYPAWVYAAIVGIGLASVAAVAGYVYLRRDAAGAWVAVAGAITGFVAAVLSAPVAAYVYGGVTGSGTDVIVAALRQGGSDVFNASLGQGMLSDPIDKTITFFAVLLILSALPARLLRPFPLGAKLVRGDDAPGPEAS